MTTKIGRNDPCHCGSGQKYKKCCLAKDDAARSADLAAQAAQAARAAAEAAAEQGEAEDAPVGGKAPTAARGPEAVAPRPKPGAGPQPPPIRRRAV
jgi:hypothetical protein